MIPNPLPYRIMLLMLLLLPFPGRSQSLSLNVPGAESEKVYLQKLDVDVKVTGSMASTTWTMTFKNETNRQLEGELTFPLAEGITVSRYAIDIAGKLREAVPVDKSKGTTVLEAIENRRVDPGLLERVEGNAFRTRVYPLPPNGVRTVVIGYEETLRSRSRGQLDYTLPLSFARAVPKIDIQVSSFGSNARHSAAGSGFDQQGNSWSARKTLTDYKSGQPLQFRIPQSSSETALMEEAGNHHYLYINTPPRTGSRERPLPQSLSILWDASLSRLSRNADAELNLLDAYLRKLSNVSVTLAVFSNNLRPKQSFSVRNGDWKALREAIGSIVYDGGTQLGKLELQSMPGEEILLFSDGLATYGPGGAGGSKVPVFTVSSNAHSDFAALRGLSQASGGAMIDLSSRPLNEAITALTRQELQLLGIRPDRDVEEIYPAEPVASAGGVALTAICYKSKGAVVLQYGFGNEVTQEVRVELDAAKQTAPGANLGRIWATQKIAALDADYDRNRPQIEQLGKRFRLVTRNTSLIVLENLSDYFLYGIEPPDELREAYDKELKWRGTQVLTAIQNRVADAERVFNELLSWWREDYSIRNGNLPDSRDPGSSKAFSMPRNGQISGRLTDQNRRAVTEAAVEIRINGGVRGSTFTGADGRYTFTSLDAGRYSVVFKYERRELAITDIVIANDQSRQVNGTLYLDESVRNARNERRRIAAKQTGNTRIIPGSNATIQGTLRDERGNPIVQAYVEATSGGVVQGRELTDFDGNYTIRPLNSGRYAITFKYQGTELVITDILLSADRLRTVNGSMTISRQATRGDVVVRATKRYVAPLIDPAQPGGRTVRTAEQIEATATRNSADAASLATQTHQRRRGESLSIGGGRTTGTKIIIDGVQQNPGAAAFYNQAPASNASSGVPARYGYTSGSLANRTDEAAGALPVRTRSYAFDPALLDALRKARPADQYAKYLELREQSMHIPAFYFQSSAHFIATGRKDLGLRILSNLAELDLENYELFKSLGYKLRELGEFDAAAEAFRKVQLWRPMDPQSLRDYGIALADQGRHQAALDTLYSALTMQIDPSLQAGNAGLEEILLCDINGLIATQGKHLNLARIPRNLVQAIPSDVRVVLNWNMKNTDIDLWVYDPSDEKCYYGHNRTEAGGRLSRDITAGFGPEQFMLRHATDGKYKVMVNYYGNRQIKISGPTVVSAEIYTNWGTPKQQRKMITLQMKPTDNGGVLVGEFVFGRGA